VKQGSPLGGQPQGKAECAECERILAAQEKAKQAGCSTHDEHLEEQHPQLVECLNKWVDRAEACDRQYICGWMCVWGIGCYVKCCRAIMEKKTQMPIPPIDAEWECSKCKRRFGSVKLDAHGPTSSARLPVVMSMQHADV